MKTVTGLDPISAGFWLANMGRQPGNAVALVGWGLGIKWDIGLMYKSVQLHA